MSREARIKLYKKIRNKYYYNLEKLPQEELFESIEAGYLLEGHERFSSHNEAIETAKARVAMINETDIADAITKGIDKYDNSYRDPVEYKNDHPFPLTHWHASDEVDWNGVYEIFNITY